MKKNGVCGGCLGLLAATAGAPPDPVLTPPLSLGSVLSWAARPAAPSAASPAGAALLVPRTLLLPLRSRVEQLHILQPLEQRLSQ